MFSTFKIKKTWLLNASGVLLMLGLIGFTEIKHQQKRCRSVVVHIDRVDGQRFLTRRDVTGYPTNQGADPVIGESYENLNLRRLEKRLSRYGLVKRCQVSHDLRGNLVVNIEQPRPLARLVSALDRNEDIRPIAGRYISEEGRFFPLSMNYSARVPLISGDYFTNRRSLSSKSGKPLLDLLTYIQADPFWRAQIVQLTVDRQGEVTLWPQVGKHRIELGPPVDVDVKFRKLKLFYKHVIPLKGWERYTRISVQYRNQIVCE